MLKRGLMLGVVLLLTFAVSAPWAISEQTAGTDEVPAYKSASSSAAQSCPQYSAGISSGEITTNILISHTLTSSRRRSRR